MTLPFAYIGLRAGLPPTSVILVKIAFDISTYVYRLFFLRRETAFAIRAYLGNALLPICLVCLTTIPLPLLLCHYVGQGALRLCTTTALTTVTIILASYYIGMDRSERTQIVNFVKAKLKR
jgi:hypothetical protein